MTEQDPSTRLRELFAADGGVVAAFSGKVADYVASRPDYPESLFDLLHVHGGLAVGARVADVGAGTGLLSQGLLDRGAEVLAVEPNAPMRAAAQHRLSDRPRFHAVDGTAEATSLPGASVDLVTAAQAFHWFDIPGARREFLRILRPEGRVALVWNDRLETDPVQQALSAFFEAHGGERQRAVATSRERQGVPAFFNGGLMAHFETPHVHWLDEAGLVALAFSRSYMPERASAQGREVDVQARALFDRHATHREAGPRVAMHYTTVAIIGRPLAATVNPSRDSP